MSFGDRLRKIRQDRRLSQPEVADMVGVSKSTYSNWENDKFYPKTRCFARLIEVFEISAEELIGANWKVTVSEPISDDDSKEKMVMEGNVFRMLETLFKNQYELQKRLEFRIEELERKSGTN